ncbi:MAG: carboxylesterase family protein, partial [Methanoregula sp.]
EILNATPELKSPFWTMRTIQFKPITDGWIIPAAPQEVFRQGTQNPVPLIVGNNAAEGIPLALDTNMTVLEYQQYIRERFGKNADQILAAYPAGTPAEVQAQTERVMTVYDFDHASKLVAGSMARLNQSTYLYRFTYALPGQPYGAYHGSELYFIFRHFPGEPDPASNKVSDTMMDYWTQFAKTGNPNGKTNVNWPEYDTRTGQYLDINTTSRVATV